MESKNMDKIIESFIDVNDPGSCLLIDGSWGCGKTYQCINFLKSYKERKKRERSKRVIYVSLFGLKSLNEIDTVLYKKINSAKRVVFATGRFLAHIFTSQKAIEQNIINEVRVAFQFCR